VGSAGARRARGHGTATQGRDNASMQETVLRWGPCDGDTVTVEEDTREIRVPVVCGTCLDELPTNLSKDVYSEALYLPDPASGTWIYSGRFRYGSDGHPYFHRA
jgi:hypothetical protein